MNEHREPSHPVSVLGRPPRGESPTETLMQVVGEAIRGNPSRETLSPGVDGKYGQLKNENAKRLNTKTMWRIVRLTLRHILLHLSNESHYRRNPDDKRA